MTVLGVDYVDGRTKKCTKCQVVKPFSEYWARRDRPIGIQPRCKECSTSWRVLHRRQRELGVSPEQYEAMFAAQGGLCAICEKPETSHNGRGLNVDHNHVTGKIRQLLCTRCNSAIGLLGEDPEVINSAAEYIRRHA